MRLLALLLLAGCGGAEPPVAAPTEAAPAPSIDPAHEAELRDAWRSREERLASEDGWLTLVALSWLDEGTGHIGATDSFEVPLPEWSGPPVLGSLERRGDRVTFTPADGVTATIGDAPVAGPTELLADTADGGPTVVHHGALSFFVVERQGRIGIRAKHADHPDRKGFSGIPRFDPSEAYRVEGTLTRFDAPRMVTFPTAIGTTDEAAVPGEIRFAIGSQPVVLLPFQDAPDDPLFFVFADKTSGIETYGGGRFLSADPPDADGKVVLDFNLATNPPCAFTPFATCPLPPPENRLAVRIEAGEKTPAGH